MCYPTPVSTRATYFQAAFDAGVVDNSRMGLLLTEGASEVQGFTGALCIHLLEYILYCHGVSSSFFAMCWLSSYPRLVWVRRGLWRTLVHKDQDQGLFTPQPISLHMELITRGRSESPTRHGGALSRADAW